MTHLPTSFREWWNEGTSKGPQRSRCRTSFSSVAESKEGGWLLAGCDGMDAVAPRRVDLGLVGIIKAT